MTARDEAIEAVLSAGLPNRHGIAAVIDAIPPNVLARLAIEQGALKVIEWVDIVDPDVPLYRMAKP